MRNKHTHGAFGRPRALKSKPALDPEIKRDIARIVRGCDFGADPATGGLCFARAVTGTFVLHLLGFTQAKTVMGGMVYRGGPDESPGRAGLLWPE
jgi:hypothetical protein